MAKNDQISGRIKNQKITIKSEYMTLNGGVYLRQPILNVEKM
jgi:hypothetical protein